MMGVLARVFGGVALLLLTFIGIGLLLPGEWTAEAEGAIDVSPDSVYRALASVTSWSEWMAWPESGASFGDTTAGPGARFSWSDEVYGDGSFVIVDGVPDRRLEYRVSVEDGSIVVDGTIELRPADGGTELRWVENGRASRNPLVAFAALGQDDRQAEQLAEVLERLREHLEARPDSANSPGPIRAPVGEDSA